MANIAKDITEISLNHLNRLLTETVLTDSGCHEWQGGLNINGYGYVQSGGRAIQAHRLAYFAEHGTIDPLLTIDHLCRNRKCVNPEHLELVTVSENTKRMIRALNRTHCPRGHNLEGDNLIKSLLEKGRACRSCDIAGRAARHRSLTGEERERYIQINADNRFKKTTIGGEHHG